MRSKVLALALAAVVMAATTALSVAMTREQAMLKCNEMVKANRSMGMSDDMRRAAAWKACMTKLGFQP